MSALATDNGSFILFTTYFNLTPKFGSQQSEVTTAVIFSYKTITRHLPSLGATANVELLSITNLISLVISYSHPRKDDTNKTSSSQLCSDRAKQNKSQVSLHPFCRKTANGFLQNVSWTRFRGSRKP